MGKPIAGFNMCPFCPDGYVTTVAKLEDGTVKKGLFIIKQRSIAQFDLSDSNEIYSFLHITGIDKDGLQLKPEYTIDELSEKLAPNTFCIQHKVGKKVVGFIVRFQLKKVVLHSGESYFLNQDEMLPVIAESLIFDKSDYYFYIGDNNKNYVKVTYEPTDADVELEFSSDNNDNIQVDSKTGEITKIKPSQSKVTVLDKLSSLTAECNVYIENLTKDIIMTGFNKDGVNYFENTGSNYALPVSFEINPEEFDINQKYTIESGNIKYLISKTKNINDGVVKLEKQFLKETLYIVTDSIDYTEVTFKVSFDDQLGKKKTNTYKLTLSPKIESISFKEKNVSMIPNETKTLEVDILPDPAIKHDITFVTSDPLTATVDSNGLVSSKKEGIVTITVKDSISELSDTCTVTITEKDMSIDIDGIDEDLYTTLTKKDEAYNFDIAVNYDPAESADKEYKLTCNDNSFEIVSDLSQTGTASYTGNSQVLYFKTTNPSDRSIKLTLEYNDYTNTLITKEYTTKVSALAEQVILSESTLDMKIGDTKVINITTIPSNVFIQGNLAGFDNEIATTVYDWKTKTITVKSIKDGSTSGFFVDSRASVEAELSIKVSLTLDKLYLDGFKASETNYLIEEDNNYVMNFGVKYDPDNFEPKDVVYTVTCSDENVEFYDTSTSSWIKSLSSSLSTFKIRSTDTSKHEINLNMKYKDNMNVDHDENTKVLIGTKAKFVEYTEKTVELAINDTYENIIKYEPVNADVDFLYSNSAPKVVRVNEDGSILALTEGEATVMVTDNISLKTSEFYVTVTDPNKTVIVPEIPEGVTILESHKSGWYNTPLKIKSNNPDRQFQVVITTADMKITDDLSKNELDINNSYIGKSTDLFIVTNKPKHQTITFSLIYKDDNEVTKTQEYNMSISAKMISLNPLTASPMKVGLGSTKLTSYNTTPAGVYVELSTEGYDESIAKVEIYGSQIKATSINVGSTSGFIVDAISGVKTPYAIQSGNENKTDIELLVPTSVQPFVSHKANNYNMPISVKSTNASRRYTVTSETSTYKITDDLNTDSKTEYAGYANKIFLTTTDQNYVPINFTLTYLDDNSRLITKKYTAYMSEKMRVLTPTIASPMTVDKGVTRMSGYTLEPSNISIYTNLSVSGFDESIAKVELVDNQIKVTGMNFGTTKGSILDAYSGIRTEYEVTVPKLIESVDISGINEINALTKQSDGYTFTFNVDRLPTTSTQPYKLVSDSDDVYIVTSTSSELTETVYEGTASILHLKTNNASTRIVKLTLTYNDGSEDFTKTYDVKLTAPVESVLVDTNDVMVKYGETKVINVSVLPEGSYSELTLDRLQPTIADVKLVGDTIEVTGKTFGKFEPRVYDAISNRGSLFYVNSVSNVPINLTKIAIANKHIFSAWRVVGDVVTIITTKTPIDATDKLIYTSSNPAVMSVDSTGRCTALSKGTTTLKVYSERDVNVQDSVSTTIR